MRALRLGVTLFVLAAVTLVLTPVQLLAIRFDWPIAARLPFFWQRLARRLIGLRVTVEGTPAPPPVLIAANHVSWLDITLLGSILPVSYIAKTEVASWPVAGWLAKLQRSIFVDRNRRSATGAANDSIAKRLQKGDTIVLFAEGTTGDGNRTLPFRSALLGAAGASAVKVQPVAIAYRRISGMPVTMVDRPRIAWYGDMNLVSHFGHLAGLGTLDAIVAFGEPFVMAANGERREAAAACEAEVKRLLEGIRTASPSSKGHGGSIFSPTSKGAKGSTGTGGGKPIVEPAE